MRQADAPPRFTCYLSAPGAERSRQRQECGWRDLLARGWKHFLALRGATPSVTLTGRHFVALCRIVEYAWRPNLPDEAGNHLVELAVAARADAIVTRNVRDITTGELRFPALKILTPEQCLERFPCQR